MRITTIASVLMLVNVVACKGKSSAPPAAAPSAAPAPAPVAAEAQPSLPSFPALPAAFDSPANPPSADKIALGRMLYYDTRLSKNQDVSCNTCHDLATYGVDNLPVSKGHRGQTGTRNSPTVYNAAGHFAQFWDGRAANVEEQAKGPVMNPVEMAMVDETRVVATLKSIPGYVAQFERAWPGDADPVTFQHMADAIGAFERKLVTPSRFDRFVSGDRSALTDDEQRGFVAFQTTGCTACHLGPTFGGQTFQKLGLVQPYPIEKDPGRFAVTRSEADRMFFKVPSLRNVEKTAPYFHDGSIADLPTAVRTMAQYQLGRPLPDQDVASIVTFLKTLTGDLPADYIKRPELPASSKQTPRPDPA